MNAIGVDPGYTGAIAFQRGENWLITDMPTIKVGKPRKKRKPIAGLLIPEKRRPATKTVLDLLCIRRLFLEHINNAGLSIVYIEKATVMPEQGITGAGHYMLAYGQIIGILVGLGIPYTEITPQSWKKEMMEGMGREKTNSVIRANQLHPALELSKTEHGKADALLIGKYGARRANSHNY